MSQRKASSKDTEGFVHMHILKLCLCLSELCVQFLELDWWCSNINCFQSAVDRSFQACSLAVVRSATILLMTKVNSKLFHYGHRSQHTRSYVACSLHNIVSYTDRALHGGYFLVTIQQTEFNHCELTFTPQHAPTLAYSVSALIQ